MLHDAPAEEHGLKFGIRGRALRHHFQVRGGRHFQIAVLHQEGIRAHAANVAELRLAQRLQHFQQPQVLLLLQNGQRVRREVRRDDHFAENFRDCLRARRVERAVHGDDAAEGRLLVRGERLVPRRAQALTLANATGIGVLENGQRGRVAGEFLDQVLRRREVENVVVGKFLAVELLEVFREAPAEHRRLVRVLPVAQRLRHAGVDVEARRRGDGGFLAREFLVQVHGDGRVVGRGARENFRRQFAPRAECGGPGGSDLLGDRRVVGGVHEDRHAVVILRRAAQHRGAADVNVLNRVVQRHVRLRDRCFKGIKIHHHQIDGRYVVLGGGGFVRGVAPDVKQPAVNLWMQRLHPPIHHLGKAGVRADVLDRQPGVAEGLGRATRGDEFHLGGDEHAGEFDETGFVGDGKERALNFCHKAAHKFPEAFCEASGKRANCAKRVHPKGPEKSAVVAGRLLSRCVRLKFLRLPSRVPSGEMPLRFSVRG